MRSLRTGVRKGQVIPEDHFQMVHQSHLLLFIHKVTSKNGQAIYC